MSPKDQAPHGRQTSTTPAEKRAKFVQAANTRYAQASAKLDAMTKLGRYRDVVTEDDIATIEKGLTAQVAAVVASLRGKTKAVIS